MVLFKAAEGGAGTVGYSKSFSKHDRSHILSLYEAKDVRSKIMYRLKTQTYKCVAIMQPSS